MSDANTTTTPNTPAGVAVACHRTVTGNGEAWMWVTGMPSLGALDNLKVHPTWRIEYAYTQPPATVSADAVLALVGKWRAKATEIAKPYGFTTEHTLGNAQSLEACADELEALTRGGK